MATNRETRQLAAAEALDKTHAIGERGPRTMIARQRLALFLDTGRGNNMQLWSDITHLRKVAGLPDN